MSNLPEPLRPRRHPVLPGLGRAAVSPTAVAAAGVGAGIGLLDHSVALAVVLAACGWSGRMIAAVAARARRKVAATLRPTQLDPWSVPEPWRQLLQQALAAQSRFDQTVAGWPSGPTRDRLAALQPVLYEEMARLGVTARQGAAAGGWTGATASSGRPSADSLAAELREVQAERARLGDRAPARLAELGQREEVVAAQLRALRRAAQAEAELHDRLRQAVTRLDQAVTELLLIEPASPSVWSPGVSDSLDELGDGISSLRAALAESSGTPPDAPEP